MIILGIDPGTTTTGFGIIESDKNKLELIDYGTIQTKPKQAPAIKLAEIYKDIKKIIKDTNPDCIAIEQLFFFKNAKTATTVGQARGVILLAAQNAKVPILEPTPLQVKMAVCSNGRAEKKQIQDMIKRILNLKEIPKPDDAADAIACAICGINYREIKDLDQLK